MSQTRSEQLLENLKKACGKLRDAQAFEDTEPFREATIQRYEYTFELAWKLMSSVLKEQGIDSFGVRNVIRDASRLGLVSDPSVWFSYAEARNKTSHTYREEIALEVYRIARGSFLNDVDALIKNLSKLAAP